MSQRKGNPAAPARSFQKNIVVFGEGGVGKSSLINLIAGRPVAATSSGAKGCTFRHKKYELEVEGTEYAIWDTAGLDEGTYGTVPAGIAEENLKRLLRDLNRAHGVHLLAYCVRASRLRKTLLSNYNLFHSAICRKKVPIVVVVTGLENYEEEMADWWAANETEFTNLKMHFDGHACVTTLSVDKVNSPIIKQRCHASRQAVLSLIAGACARDRWRTEQESWVSTAVADVRAMFRPARPDGSQPTPIVVLYDLPECPLGTTRGISSFEGGRLMDLGGTPLLVYRVHHHQLLAGARFQKQISSRGADLLVLCASVRSNLDASRRCAAAFYGSYGGETRPLLVVVKDATSDDAASGWWNTFDDKPRHHASGAGALRAIVYALPPPDSTERSVSVVKLTRAIQTRSLQPVEVAPTGCFGWSMGGKRPLKLRAESAPSIFVEEDCLTKSRVWVPWSQRP